MCIRDRPFRVEVDADEVAELELTAELGGRVRLQVRLEGAPPGVEQPTIRVRASRGVEDDPRHVGFLLPEGGGWRRVPELPAETACLSHEPFPPGIWSLRLEAPGYLALDHAVVIDAGDVGDLLLTLRPE